MKLHVIGTVIDQVLQRLLDGGSLFEGLPENGPAGKALLVRACPGTAPAGGVTALYLAPLVCTASPDAALRWLDATAPEDLGRWITLPGEPAATSTADRRVVWHAGFAEYHMIYPNTPEGIQRGIRNWLFTWRLPKGR